MANKVVKFIGNLGFKAIMIFLVFVFEIAMLKFVYFSKFQMPFLMLFKNQNRAVLFVFLIGLVMAMISTAVACLIGVKNKIKFSKNDENFIKIIVILSSLILGQIPFIFFIKFVYPTVAIFNFVIFILEIFEIKKFSKSQNVKN